MTTESFHTTNIETEAFVVQKYGSPFTLETIVLDELQPNEVLVEMLYSGICHTDLGVRDGVLPLAKPPFVLGHEGAGIVRAIGSAVKNKTYRPGDRVLLSMSFCETCRQCRANRPTDCDEGTRLQFAGVRADGSSAATLKSSGEEVRHHFFGQSSFSRLSFVQETSVVRVPDEVEDEVLPYLSAMGCGFQTGAGTVENILKPEADSSILIFGLGTVGLAAIMAAKYMDVRQIIGVDIHDYKLPLAQELGATHVVNSMKVNDVVTTIMDLTKGVGVDYTIDCTGVPSVVEAMLNVLAHRGTAVSVGLAPAGKKISVDPQMWLVGSKAWLGRKEGGCFPEVYIPHLCRMQKAGKFPVEKLCQVYDYTDFELALKDLQDGKVTKPVIRWQSEVDSRALRREMRSVL